MRLSLSIFNRRLLIATDDDIETSEDEFVQMTGGDYAVAPVEEPVIEYDDDPDYAQKSFGFRL
jgi:hypothetical protein